MQARAGAADLAFYAAPGRMTALPEGTRLAALPRETTRLCQLSRQLIVHEFMAPAYGIEDAERRAEELEHRSVADILRLIEQQDPGGEPVPAGLPPQRRIVGNCRQFVVLTCALLRGAGVPARARVGFGAYLDESWTDHWIVERWDSQRAGWVQTDPQLDDVFQREIGFDFDPLHVPAGQFLSGSQAWRRCRAGEDDPARFGIDDLRGWWFVAGNTIRDLAALNKVELLPWDVWGRMPGPDDELDDELVALLDEVAATVVDGSLDAQRKLYQQDGLRVPEVVFSVRFQRPVALGAG